MHRQQYDVTVCVAHRNLGGYLPRAIQSLAYQRLNGATMEVIVVDDGSDDPSSLSAFSVEESLMASAAWADRTFTFVRTGERIGMACVRNLVAARARGTALAFVDADDTVGPGYVATLVAGMKRTGASWLLGNVYVETFEGPVHGGTETPPDRLVGVGFDKAIELGSIACYETALVRRMGGWAEGCDLSAYDEAAEFNTRLLRNGVHYAMVPMRRDNAYRYLQRHKRPDESRRATRRWSINFVWREAGSHTDHPIVRTPGLVTTPRRAWYVPIGDPSADFLARGGTVYS